MKTTNLLSVLLLLIILLSCNKKEDQKPVNNPSSTEQKKFGDVGNEWHMRVMDHEMSARIVENVDGLIKLELTREDQIDTLLLRLKDNVIYEYVHSLGDTSKPFTLVEFGAQVGAYYEFDDGYWYFRRDVTGRESYHIECLGQHLETIAVYENMPYGMDIPLFGCTIRTIYWYWNPVYGLVCIEIETDNCGFIEIQFISIDLG
ncbi:MAG: hypothetical protein KDC05_13345 [Bacteroidales bacterium]|nr:hypothetical protein [Bacteroidales bacterium]